MRKNRVICTLMLVILVSFGISSWNIDMANANFMYPPLERIYIKADGSVSPQANSFRVTGDVYTLVANITNYGLEIQRDNIVVDGAGFVLQKNMPAMGRQEAVGLNGIRNVTVKNFDIRGYGYGVYLSNAHDCSIIDNTFSSNKYGIALTDKSAFNFVSNNSWLSGGGIFITNSPNNVLKSNSIDGAGPNFWIDCENVTSTSDFVNDVDESNTIKGKPVYYWVNRQDQVVPSNAGFVALISCTSITVENLNLTNNGQGVLLVETRSSKLAANNLTGNNKGIALYNSQNNQVTGNNFTNNTYGIICRSRPNTFKENKLQNNTYDANFEDRFFDEFDRSNIVDGKPICYWLWQTNKVVPTDSGYVVLLSCKNVTVQNLNITNRRQGMYLDGLENSLITRNIVTNNVAGIILKGSTNNKIKGNLITNNSDGIYVEASSLNEFSANKIAFSVNFGIRFEDDSANMVNFNYISHGKVGFTMNRGSNNVISGNTVIYTQEKGMHIGESVNNKVTGNNVAWSKGYALTISGNVGNNSIYYNDFVNNAMSAQAQAYPGANTQNIWDDGQRGNFWSDYEQRYPTAKQRTASTWDTSVTMNANNIDRYPLTQPVNMKYQVTILQPANTSYNTNALPFFISVTGPVSWIAYSIDNKANVTTKTDAMLNDLLLGSHKLTVYAGHEKGRCASETIYFETTQNSTSTSQPTSNPAFATPQGTEQPSTTISPSATLQPTPSEKGSLPTAVPASRGILDESKAVLPIAVGIIVLIAGGSTVLLKKSKKSQPK